VGSAGDTDSAGGREAGGGTAAGRAPASGVGATGGGAPGGGAASWGGARSPEVTVIMAAHNAAAYIAESIQGVLDQTYPDFQLLVVDDCSTDSTRDIVRSHTDPRIKLIALERNVGPGAARNLAMRTAATELVANNDADDVSLPERLERQVAYMRAHPECVLLGSAFKQVLDDGTPAGDYFPPVDPALVKWMLFNHNVVGNSTAMFRRETALSVGGYDETLRYAEDYALWIALAGAGEVANLPDVLVRYRLNSAGLTAARRDLRSVVPAAVAQRAIQAALGRPVSLEAVQSLQGVRPPGRRRGAICREAARAVAETLAGMIGSPAAPRGRDGRGSASRGYEALPQSELLADAHGQLRDLCFLSPASALYIARTYGRLAARVSGTSDRGRSGLASSLPFFKSALDGLVARRRPESQRLAEAGRPDTPRGHEKDRP
jgi:hypothetical protein